MVNSPQEAEPTEVYGCGETRHEAMQSLSRNLNFICRQFGIQYDIGVVKMDPFCDEGYFAASAPLISPLVKDLTSRLAGSTQPRSDA